ncbi:MAG TPA: hypothetical protein VNN73_05635 [Blastocatellia bacterium]|nr:hypothetical protein [Blastocatellia bacterium]
MRRNNNRTSANARLDESQEPVAWRSVGEIYGFPFSSFDELQAAVAARSFQLGVDPFAAAEWSARFNSPVKKTVIAALSLLLVIAGAASIIAAFVVKDYWLLAAAPIQATVFYVAHPAWPYHKWATAGGALTVPVFINLLLNEMTTAATLVAYAGLTFAAVRAAAFIANSAFRKALLGDEQLFLAAFANRVCTLRNSRTNRVFAA